MAVFLELVVKLLLGFSMVVAQADGACETISCLSEEAFGLGICKYTIVGEVTILDVQNCCVQPCTGDHYFIDQGTKQILVTGNCSVKVQICDGTATVPTTQQSTTLDRKTRSSIATERSTRPENKTTSTAPPITASTTTTKRPTSSTVVTSVPTTSSQTTEANTTAQLTTKSAATTKTRSTISSTNTTTSENTTVAKVTPSIITTTTKIIIPVTRTSQGTKLTTNVTTSPRQSVPVTTQTTKTTANKLASPRTSKPPTKTTKSKTTGLPQTTKETSPALTTPTTTTPPTTSVAITTIKTTKPPPTTTITIKTTKPPPPVPTTTTTITTNFPITTTTSSTTQQLTTTTTTTTKTKSSRATASSTTTTAVVTSTATLSKEKTIPTSSPTPTDQQSTTPSEKYNPVKTDEVPQHSALYFGVGCAVAVLAIIVALIVIVCFMKRRKAKDRFKWNGLLQRTYFGSTEAIISVDDMSESAHSNASVDNTIFLANGIDVNTPIRYEDIEIGEIQSPINKKIEPEDTDYTDATVNKAKKTNSSVNSLDDVFTVVHANGNQTGSNQDTNGINKYDQTDNNNYPKFTPVKFQQPVRTSSFADKIRDDNTPPKRYITHIADDSFADGISNVPATTLDPFDYVRDDRQSVSTFIDPFHVNESDVEL